MVMDVQTYQENSRQKYNNSVDKRKNIMLGKILSLVGALVPNKYQWEQTRKYILSVCNDCFRENQFDLEQNYILEYIDSKEDVIEITQSKKNQGGAVNG